MIRPMTNDFIWVYDYQIVSDHLKMNRFIRSYPRLICEEKMYPRSILRFFVIIYIVHYLSDYFVFAHFVTILWHHTVLISDHLLLHFCIWSWRKNFEVSRYLLLFYKVEYENSELSTETYERRMKAESIFSLCLTTDQFKSRMWKGSCYDHFTFSWKFPM